MTIEGTETEGQALARAITEVAESRDKASFALLFDHFAPRLKAYMMRQGAPPAQADDLAQEAMVSVWRKAHLYDPGKAAATTWVFTIARNLRIDALRKERRPEVDVDDPGVRALADPADGADHHVDQAQRARLVRAAMKGLPAEQLEVVRLAFYGDKPHSEIAAHLGLPMGTVKSRLRLAMKKIRAALALPIEGEIEQ